MCHRGLKLIESSTGGRVGVNSRQQTNFEHNYSMQYFGDSSMLDFISFLAGPAMS